MCATADRRGIAQKNAGRVAPRARAPRRRWRQRPRGSGRPHGRPFQIAQPRGVITISKLALRLRVVVARAAARQIALLVLRLHAAVGDATAVFLALASRAALLTPHVAARLVT